MRAKIRAAVMGSDADFQRAAKLIGCDISSVEDWLPFFGISQCCSCGRYFDLVEIFRANSGGFCRECVENPLEVFSGTRI